MIVLKPNTTDYRTFRETTNNVLGKRDSTKTTPNDLILNLTKRNMNGPYETEWKTLDNLKKELLKLIQLRNQIKSDMNRMTRQYYELKRVLPIIQRSNERCAMLTASIGLLEKYISNYEHELNRKTRDAWNFAMK